VFQEGSTWQWESSYYSANRAAVASEQDSRLTEDQQVIQGTAVRGMSMTWKKKGRVPVRKQKKEEEADIWEEQVFQS